MAAGGGQISSLHLAIAAGGGVLLYAALRGVSPAQALKDIADGSPPAVSTEGKTISGSGGGGGGDSAVLPGGYGSDPWKGVYRKSKAPKSFHTPLLFITALQTHASEKYSQSKRWAKGYSDCASFAGKGLLDIGIDAPGGSNTGAYLGSSQWVKVSSPRMGDVAVNNQHMAVFTSGAAGIGQQNPSRNVQRDTMDNLMANTGPWEIRRYKGWA